MAESVLSQGAGLVRLQWLVFALVANVIGACATHQVPQDSAASDCALVEGADSPDGSWPLLVAMDGTGRFDRFVADQVGETLIRLDCRGRPQPGLATTWSSSDGGRSWSFSLRRDARFSDGTMMTAGDVARSFREAAVSHPSTPSDADLLRWAGIRSARIRGDTAIVLEFVDVSPSVPPVLAHPVLSIINRTAAGPIGSGAFHVEEASGGDPLSLVGSGDAHITLGRVNADARDALDRGVDVLVTGDVRALEYAAGLEGYLTIPLPWERAYVVVMPTAHSDMADAIEDPYLPGIVGITSRAPVAPAPPPTGWWRDPRCSPPAPSAEAIPRNARLLYDSDDAIARRIAERLVAVIGAGGPADDGLIAEGLDSAAYRRSMSTGADQGYVVRLPADPLAPCLAAANLLHNAPWLNVPGTAVYPVVETRPYAVVRPDRVAGRLVVEWGGRLRVLPENGEPRP